MRIFTGNAHTAYRDPACFCLNGVYHLFFTYSEKEDGYLYNRVAKSESRDLVSWSAPVPLTVKNRTLNFSSPGNVLRRGADYLLTITSYPMPRPYAERPYADESARLFIMRSPDLCTFSAPERLYPKGKDCPPEAEGRMIDPFLFKPTESSPYRLFYKQNGVSTSSSEDLEAWRYEGRAEAGENVCILPFQGQYLMLHSPENGIGFKTSSDLLHWEDRGLTCLRQKQWPWASGRLTAGFAMASTGATKYRYLVFFHGSRAESLPETHGSASLAVVFTDDFAHFSETPFGECF